LLVQIVVVALKNSQLSLKSFNLKHDSFKNISWYNITQK
jgi:hypothetical protein